MSRGVVKRNAARRAAVAGRGPTGDLVDPVTGAAVEMTEARRVALALGAAHAAAAVPEACGDAIPEAPARGPMKRTDPVELVPDGGGYRAVQAGWRGRAGVRVADVFDRMVDQAHRAHRGKAGFGPPFEYGQVQAARDYAALTERCAAAGVKGSSLEMLSGGGSGGGREEAIMADLQRLRALHRRIGDGLAKEVRRIRPKGRERHAIRVRRLVDDVCLGDKALAVVLRAHGWSVNQKSLDGLRRALGSALDRMQGYDLAGSQHVG